MSAIDYGDLVKGLIEIYRDDPRLEDVQHFTDDPDDPTTEQCPAILVDYSGFTRDPRRLAAAMRSASPYDETIRLEVKVWVFSGQGPADARRRRDSLVRLVMDVTADNFTLGGRALSAQCLRGDCRVLPHGGGVFAVALLGIDVLAQT